MQISTPSCQEIPTREHGEPACPLQCPLCSGPLVLLHNSYRCSSCAYHLCASCEPIDFGLPGSD